MTTRLLSTYSSDLFGMCSALYELGGLCVMHDASGCNSTYCTHDEPRWFDIDSMIYISALTEEDVIMGRDEKLIQDAVSAVDLARKEGHPPRFVAIALSPMPFMIGCDSAGIARAISERTGLPALGLSSSGMKDYTAGAGAALSWLVDAFCIKALPPEQCVKEGEQGGKINILGATPLDFSSAGNIRSLKAFYERGGSRVIGTWAMGTTLEEIERAGMASMNAVVSAAGLSAAKRLKEVYGTPYEVGIPINKGTLQSITQGGAANMDGTLIIGEAVFAHSLRLCLENEYAAKEVRVLCPLEETCGLLRADDMNTDDEKKIMDAMRTARTVIADPLYQRALLKQGASAPRFVGFPHEAYSGRMFRDRIPIFTG